jgi:hypothetical protein
MLNLQERFNIDLYKRIATPDACEASRLDIPFVRPPQTRGGVRGELLDENFQSQARKAPFNVQGKQRIDPQALEKGVLSYNPGPGSYTTRMSSMKTTYVPKE